jgi:hypothetical protein
METSKFLDDIIAGNAADAKESLNDLLSAKAFAALEDRKIELAKSIYANNDDENDEEETVEYEEEEEQTV